MIVEVIVVYNSTPLADSSTSATKLRQTKVLVDVEKEEDANLAAIQYLTHKDGGYKRKNFIIESKNIVKFPYPVYVERLI